MLPYYNGIEVKINNKKCREFPNIWKLSNTILNNQLVKREIKSEI